MCTNISKNNNRHSNPAPKKNHENVERDFLIFISAMCYAVAAAWHLLNVQDRKMKKKMRSSFLFPFALEMLRCVFKKYFISLFHSHPSEIGYWHRRVLCYLPNNIFVLTLHLCKHLEEGENDFFCYIYVSHLACL